MGCQRDAGVGCRLINREVGVYDGQYRFGQGRVHGGLRLVRLGGERVSGDRGRPFLARNRVGRLLPNSLVLPKNLVQPISLSFQSLQDKGERGLL
jgi:hypothetical protein